MAYLPAWQRSCDCRCPLHYRHRRTTYDDRGCACTITCATQPITLLADQWGGALFLDEAGNLWHVPALPGGNWGWDHAAEIDDRSEPFAASVIIEHMLQLSAHVLAHTRY